MKYILILLFLLPLSAQAQSIHVSAGAALPTGHLGDYWNPGYSIEGGVSLPLLSRLDVGITAGYAAFGMDREAVRAETGVGPIVSISGGDESSLHLMSSLRYWIPATGRIVPYISLASGMYRISVDEVTVGAMGYSEQTGDMAEVRLGVQARAGLAFVIGAGTALTFDASYLIGFRPVNGKDVAHMPLAIGLIHRFSTHTQANYFMIW